MEPTAAPNLAAPAAPPKGADKLTDEYRVSTRPAATNEAAGAWAFIAFSMSRSPTP